MVANIGIRRESIPDRNVCSTAGVVEATFAGTTSGCAAAATPSSPPVAMISLAGTRPCECGLFDKIQEGSDTFLFLPVGLDLNLGGAS